MFITTDVDTAINLNYVRKLKVMPTMKGWCVLAVMDDGAKYQIGVEEDTREDAKDWLKELVHETGGVVC